MRDIQLGSEVEYDLASGTYRGKVVGIMPMTEARALKLASSKRRGQLLTIEALDTNSSLPLVRKHKSQVRLVKS